MNTATSSLCANLPALISYWDKSCHNQFASEIYIAWFGLTPAQLKGMPLREVLGEALYQQTLPNIEAVLRGEHPRFERELRLRLPNSQKIRYALLELKPDWNRGEVCGFYAYHTDITDIKRAQQILQANDQRYLMVLDNMSDGILIFGADGHVTFVSKSYAEQLGYTNIEDIGRDPEAIYTMIHPDDRDKLFAKIYAAIDAKFIDLTYSYRAKHKLGHYIWRQDHAIYNYDSSGQYAGSYVNCRDISALKQAEDTVANLTFYDPLTQLPNRNLLLSRLQQASIATLSQRSKHALLIIHLDNFKGLNNTLGYTQGDKVLKQVGARLQKCVPPSATVARLGGGEFAILIENLSQQISEALAATQTIADMLLTELLRPYLPHQSFRHSISIGASLATRHRHTELELLKQADFAMCEAQKQSGNAVRFFDQHLQEDADCLITLENHLYDAMAKQELQLYYQIQVDHLGNATGAEALLRWLSPELGWIGPKQFIPLAERSDLILSIGDWVLEKACAQLLAWQSHPATAALVLAVNVSAKQFHQSSFVDDIKAMVARYGIKPAQLKLELTESMLIDQVESIIAKMSTLKDLGIQFSLDDFGTGYSSLQHLKRLPINQIKIDQSFVRNIETDNDDKSIVRTIIAMATSMKLSIIAEGVETEQQAGLLFRKGCLEFQGYLFGKPMPIEQFNATLLPQKITH